ncbi:hypothetical protein [Planctomycetes bacterium K23_9]|uniref:Uncharacterized protein n=1 Tax=Stieleria marina TaxID=1930275 RepID=A0A517P2S1_9BACT|nr:hypothetical protein K239x_56860 [Planctomycetes bacterium K23_9]
MKSLVSPTELATKTTVQTEAETAAPREVQVIRTLGHGRAARAQLVTATLADGSKIQCVEKVFAPGLLTRLIYRFSFQSPFAYQKNRDAILSCFYRRKVAAAVFASAGQNEESPLPTPDVAQPIYVRYDEASRAWVLAANWVNGRGITPAPVDSSRLSRWLRTVTTRGQSNLVESKDEIDQLVDVMSKTESLLGQCGLYGSGWQVAPRALVSTANLLRVGDQYTVIDLESGIPAFLVPRYIASGMLRGTFPPFDDVDAQQLRNWINVNERVLTFRIGPDAVYQLRINAEKLIHHSEAWKSSEWAGFRQPWNWFAKGRRAAYRTEIVRRWLQEETIDQTTFEQLGHTPIKVAMIWLAGLLPSSMGRFASQLFGRADVRAKVMRFIKDRDYRATKLRQNLCKRYQRLVDDERIAPDTMPRSSMGVVHGILECVTPPSLHRLLVDVRRQKETAVVCLLLLFSKKYQSWFGQSRIEASIERWQDSQRITDKQAKKLRGDLCGEEVGAYTRGLGLHLALKAMAPIILPAKVGGVAAFAGTGNAWFLLPIVITPILRTIFTIGSAITNRHQRIPHGEALMVCWIPTFGSAAFLLQMFSNRPRLSTFLIRDAASKVGRKIPIYGGADSRTEMAFIRATDFLIEWMKNLTGFSQRLRSAIGLHQRGTTAELADVVSMTPRTPLTRWLDRMAVEQIARREQKASSADAGVSVRRAA